MTKKHDEAGPRHANGTDVGRHLGMTRQAVRQLVQQGVLAELPGGGFSLDDCRLRYITHLRTGRRGARSEAETAFRDARVREVQLRIAERERQLMKTDEAIGFVDELCALVNRELAGLPARIAGRDRHLRQRVEDEVHAIRRKMAAKVEKMEPRNQGADHAP